jgi:hypothetical protein
MADHPISKEKLKGGGFVKTPNRGWKAACMHVFGIILVLGLCVSCSTGSMEVKEMHYYAVPGDYNTNYFRLRVNAETQLGDAEYRSGFFPANAVDSLFGDVSSEGGAQALETRRTLEKQIQDSLVAVNNQYQEKARDPETSLIEIDKLLEARRRVLTYPVGNAKDLRDAIEIDYNPSKGLAIRRSDEKQVFVLSSNPDEVVGKISNFAESDKTVYSINQFAKVIAQRSRNDIAARQATEEVNQKLDQLILVQIQKALEVLTDTPKATDKNLALNEIDILIQLLENVGR